CAAWDDSMSGYIF
nr:immunoglobulin light chain junction region [Macaca mulatta]